jgi:hypothetical protein
MLFLLIVVAVMTIAIAVAIAVVNTKKSFYIKQKLHNVKLTV